MAQCSLIPFPLKIKHPHIPSWGERGECHQQLSFAVQPPAQLETELWFVKLIQMSQALLHACVRSDRSPSTPGTGHLWRPESDGRMLLSCTPPGLHYWRVGMERRESFIFFSPVIVDNMPRHDAFEAEVQEKVWGFYTVLLLAAGIKTLYTEERTYTCKHLTTTSGFPVCCSSFVFWLFVVLFFFFPSSKGHFHTSLQKEKTGAEC